MLTISHKDGSVSSTGTKEVKHGLENIQSPVTSFSFSVRRISRFMGNVTGRFSYKKEPSKVKFKKRSMNSLQIKTL